MTPTVEEVLCAPGRRWTRNLGASAEEIDRLVSASPCPLPSTLLELLRFSNGGAGDLALPPQLFMLSSVEEIIAGLRDPFLKDNFPGFVFFGDNGSLESIPLDCRHGQPFPIVMIDAIAGPDSADRIASDFAAFLASIGLTYVESECDESKQVVTGAPPNPDGALVLPAA
jgi:hypothetical protein